MSDAKLGEPETDRKILALEPFDFWPSSASRIAGLGGDAIDSDPAYAFHTHYGEIAAGLVRCTLRFTGLIATSGEMAIRINALPSGPNSRAESIRTIRVRLRDIEEAGGTFSFTFDAGSDRTHAVLGHIYGEADSRADSLAIEVETIEVSQQFTKQLDGARKSIFGRRMFRRANRMIADDRPTLIDPVSQGCTAEQFDEPTYASWLARMRLPLHRHRKQWEFIYILQSLERYGMLVPHARGLGFGVGVEPLPAVMAAAGCSIVATDLAHDDARAQEWHASDQHLATVDQLRNPAICADDVFDRQVTHRNVDMNFIDQDLTGFDFTWSSCSLEHLGSIAQGLDFIRNSIDCLKPGGLAVHTTELNLTSNTTTIDNAGTVLFRRQDIERIAVDLVSRGHFVAQIKYDFGKTPLDQHVDVPPYSANDHLKLALGGYVTTSFGLIIRRGDR